MIVPFVSCSVQTQARNMNRAVLAKFYGSIEERPEPFRVAIRRQPHNLVFIRIKIESQVERDERIENTDGIMRGYMMELLQLSLASAVYRSAMDFSHSVDDDHETVIPSRRVVCAGGMCQMM